MDFWCEILNWFSYSSASRKRDGKIGAAQELMFWNGEVEKIQKEVYSILIQFCRNFTPCFLLQIHQVEAVN